MCTLSTLSSRLQMCRARGLTLVEILVVVVLIGIILSLATLSLSTAGPQVKMREEGRRLLRLMELARETAIFESRELALVMDEEGYRFQELRARQWQDITDDEVLRARKLDAGIRMRLRLEATEVSFGEDEGVNPPRVFLLSSGEATPFELQLEADGSGWRYLLVGDSLGHFELRQPETPGASG